MPRRLLRPSAAVAWKLAAGAFLILALATYAGFVRNDWRTTEAFNRATVEGTADLIAVHAATAFDQTQQGLRLIAKEFESSDPEQERQRFQREFAVFVAASQPVGTVWAVDGQGRALADNTSAHLPLASRDTAGILPGP